MTDQELVKKVVGAAGLFKNYSVLARVFFMRPEQMNRVKNGKQRLRPEVREAIESLLDGRDPLYVKYSCLTRAAIFTGRIIDLRVNRKEGPWVIRIMKGKGEGKVAWVENSDPDLIRERLKAATLGLEYESC